MRYKFFEGKRKSESPDKIISASDGLGLLTVIVFYTHHANLNMGKFIF